MGSQGFEELNSGPVLYGLRRMFRGGQRLAGGDQGWVDLIPLQGGTVGEWRMVSREYRVAHGTQQGST